MSAHLTARPRAAYQLPTPTMGECEAELAQRRELDRLLAESADEAEAERFAHSQRIERCACDCGRKVAAGELLIGDAVERVNRLVYLAHPAAKPPRYVMPPDIADAIARDAWARGVVASRKAVAL